MDSSCMSMFPSYSWFRFIHAVGPSHAPSLLHVRLVNNLAVLVMSGTSSNRWISQGRETRFNTEGGMVGFFSADEEEHTLAVSTDTSVKAFILSIPPAHLQSIASSEGLTPAGASQACPMFHDAVIRASLMRLVAAERGCTIAHDLGAEVAARCLVLRLTELMYGRTPDWRGDASTFDHRTMGKLVDYIDAHLQHFTPLADLASQCEMSPSHFAKKFRLSAGLSLQRFVNRRRLTASMALLESGSTALSQVALDLGFSSQSHFTRMFSSLTGVTPANYRRQFGRP